MFGVEVLGKPRLPFLVLLMFLVPDDFQKLLVTPGPSTIFRRNGSLPLSASYLVTLYLGWVMRESRAVLSGMLGDRSNGSLHVYPLLAQSSKYCNGAYPFAIYASERNCSPSKVFRLTKYFWLFSLVSG